MFFYPIKVLFTEWRVKMKKESRVVLNDTQHEQLVHAAEKSGMALATFIRSAALAAADRAGIHAEQPQPD